jgi:creatinine amidohydrolase
MKRQFFPRFKLPSAMAESRFLADHAAHTLHDRLTPNSVIVLGLGAIEAHGPHLPVSTDFVLADATTTAAVQAFGDQFELWQLPTLPFTKSNEHAWAPGTFWLSATTMLATLDDLARSLTLTPAQTLVFVNAHGGNSALLQVALRDVRLKYGLRTFLMHPWMATDEGNELGMSIHAGHDETSLMMHVRPDLVDLSTAVRRVPEHLAANRHVRFGGSVAFGWLSNDFDHPDDVPAGSMPLGMIGDPTKANAAHGKVCFDSIVKTMGEQFDEIVRFDPRIKPHQHNASSGVVSSEPAI